MKRIYNFIFAASALLAVSCAKEQVPAVENTNEPKMVQKTFTADLGTETKTSLHTDGKSVYWTAADKISVFDNVNNTNNSFESSNINGSGADFTGYTAEGATEYVAVYPYKFGTTYKENVITTAVPLQQKAVKGSFDNNLNIAVAKSADGEHLSFKNACALLKVTIPEDMDNVAAISVAAGTYLSGKVLITLDGETFTVAGSTETRAAFKEVNLDNGGAAMEPGDYYIVVIPGTHSARFHLGVTTTEGETYVKYKILNSDNAVTLEPNDVLNLGNVPTSGSKDFKVINLPTGPVSVLDTWTLGYEIGEGYTGKVLSWVKRNSDIVTNIAGDTENQTATVTFGNKVGSAMVYATYDGVNYPVTFDVRPWYRDEPAAWQTVTSGATYAESTTDAGEKCIVVTTADQLSNNVVIAGRADLRRQTSSSSVTKAWMSPALAPIVAIRMDDLNDSDNKVTANINLNFSANFTYNSTGFTGNVGGDNNKWQNRYDLSDGSSVLVYDLSQQKVGGKMLPDDFLADGRLDIKYADIKKDGAAYKPTYRFFWFRTFGSLADLESYLSDWAEETSQTYEKVK